MKPGKHLSEVMPIISWLSTRSRLHHSAREYSARFLQMAYPAIDAILEDGRAHTGYGRVGARTCIAGWIMNNETW